MSNQFQAIKHRFGIIGTSKMLDSALDTAVRVAPTDLSVLITGESGVGKEVFSKIIHSLSPRKHNQFIAVNCGAIPDGTINSELFGHEKGSFTGAVGERKGYFETVDGGTIFLDEIGEMPLDTQAYLLRILESGEFMRVGSSKVLNTDVRVIAATNVNLQESIQKGKFREDLYYRLNTVPIKVPSLKERREDIYTLFRKFSSDFSEKYRTPTITLDDRAQILFENYPWPGNIRELKNVAEQISLLSKEKLVTAEVLIDLMPNVMNRNLPAISRGGAGGLGNSNNFEEREILYKLLFEMKSDLNDLKSLVYELITKNNLSVSDVKSLTQLLPMGQGRGYAEDTRDDHRTNIDKDDISQLIYEREKSHEVNRQNENRINIMHPLVMDKQGSKGSDFDKMELVEESLSLVDMEKELIVKALKKHHGRRKDASEDLGISERTLYRKIKEYDLEQ
jgi:transcriptional regulator with PAS, ATPase and Fis domain